MVHKNAIFMTCGYRNALQFQQCFLLTIRLLVINILPKAVGRNLFQRRKSNQSKSLLFCLCVFFLEPTNAKRSVIGRSASVPWSWSALRRPHQLRELSQTQPFNLGLLTFSVFCSLSSIIVPAERRFKERKKTSLGII